MRNHPGQLLEEETGDSSQSDAVTLRQAQLSDIPAILHLINDYASQAIMLPRTEMEMCESLRDFVVAIEDGQLLGCGGLHFYTQHMAELRSLAVASSRTRSGLGQRVAQQLLEQACESGIDVVFAFTYVPGFFSKLGFEIVDRGALPLKAWKDCVRCPKFQACDEIAMACMLTPGADIFMSAMPTGEPVEETTLFPILGTPRILDHGAPNILDMIREKK